MSLVSFAKNLTEISDESKRLVSSKLVNLSTISTEEMPLFLESWAKTGLERRRQIASQLVELAEEEPKLNFDDIFLACLHDELGPSKACGSMRITLLSTT